MADEELVMYLVLVKDKEIKMGPGKAIAQAGHVIANMVTKLMSENPSLWDRYVQSGVHPKIVLQASTAQMDDLIANQKCLWIRDVGRTQVPAGTLTAIAFPPMPKNKAPAVLNTLKLY